MVVAITILEDVKGCLMDLLMDNQLTALPQGSVVAITNMNKLLKAFIIAVIFFLLSGFISVLIIFAEKPESGHKSLLTDYSKLDIQTQVTQDVGIIEEQ